MIKRNEDQNGYGVDKALMALSVVVLLVASYFLLFGDMGSQNRSELVPVGQISDTRNDVRRKLETGFAWSNIDTQSNVFEGDSIFTGDGSKATINLNSGGKIDVDPKSLVVIRTQGKKLRLDLQYGSLVGKVSAENPIVIAENGRIQEISGEDAEIKIESSADKETKIQVIRGKIKMREAPIAATNVEIESALNVAEEKIVAQNQVLQLKPEAPAVVKRVVVELESPANGRILWLPPGRPTELKWKFIDPKFASASIVELSNDSSFEKPFASLPVSGTKLLLAEEQRGAGNFHWRVRSADKKDSSLPSASSHLTIYPDLPPHLVFPADAQEFAYNAVGGEKGKEVQLNWEDKSGSTEFELQLGTDPEFKSAVIKKRLGNVASERTEVLGSGKYYWRLRGLHPQRAESPWSQTLSFSIDEDAKMPAVPVLAKTKFQYVIPETVLAKAPRGATVEDGPGVMPVGLEPFSWKPVENAEGYEIEIAANPSFDNALKHQVVNSETSFSPSEILPGSMYVRVRAQGKRGLTSDPSAPAQLDVSIAAPVLQPIDPVVQKFKSADEAEKGRHDFEIKWSPRSYAESYELEWGADETFARSKKFRLQGSDRKITVTRAMGYAARVRALGPGAVPLSAYSNVVLTDYKKEIEIPPPVIAPIVKAPPVPAAPRLPATASAIGRGPKLLLPQRNSSFVSLENATTFVSFRWGAIKNAKTYEVELADDADFTHVVGKFKASSTSYTFKKELPEGRIFWRVRAEHPKGKTDWSDVFDLNVLYD